MKGVGKRSFPTKSKGGWAGLLIAFPYSQFLRVSIGEHREA